MSDRDQPNAAQRTGASLMTRVDAADGAGSSPRRLAESGGTTHHRPSEAGHLGNPGLSDRPSQVVVFGSVSSPIVASKRGAGGEGDECAFSTIPEGSPIHAAVR